MTKYRYLGALAFVGGAILLIPAAASAQTVSAQPRSDPNAGATADATDLGEVVVTGTRISRPGMTSPVPVTSLSATELLGQTGNISLGDTAHPRTRPGHDCQRP